MIMKIYEKKMNKKIFFSLYIIMESTDEIKYSQYDHIPSFKTNKDDQFRKEIESIPYTIKYIRDKKIRDFEKIFRMEIDCTYEINDPLLIRHFFFKAVEEVNDDLINNKKTYRVHFRDETNTHFINETQTYWEKIGFHNDDGTLNNSKVDNHIKTLDLIIR